LSLKKESKLLGILLIILLTFNLNSGDNSDLASVKSIDNYDIKLSDTYNDITIDDLPGSLTNWTWAESEPWCTGTGTFQDPYVIESHLLNVKGINQGIYISNSHNKYFIIRNCTFYWDGAMKSGFETGVKLTNTTKGQIYNNIAYGLPTGLFFVQSENLTITNNTVYNTMSAIYLSESNSSHVYENTAYSNEIGISLSMSFNNSIYNNIVYSNTNGIQVSNSENNNIYENTAFNNFDNGILLWYSDNNTVEENELNNNDDIGIEINHGHNNTVSGNFINDNGNNGIYLDNSDNNTISENTVFNNGTTNQLRGIFLSISHNNKISGNTIYNNTQYGIYLSNSEFNSLSGNTAYRNDLHGIHLTSSSYNSLSGNTVYNNTLYGISLQSTSDENNITENIVYNNIQHGINLDDSWNLFVWDNYIYQNGIYGIYAASCKSDEFYGNVIRDNIDTGVLLDSSSNMFFYENFFLGNNKHAFDDATNFWNSTSIGNYWDNWTSPDDSSPYGIVDIQYNISGSAGNADYLPIAEDGAPTIIINSPYLGAAFDNSAPSFNVRITDDYLDEIWYTIDGGLNNYTFTDNGTIDESAWDAMLDGIITLTFYASDIPGNIGTAEVNIDKDNQVPIISINSPNPGEKFALNAPSFNVRVIEDHVDIMWYTINGGLNNYTFTVNGTIDQTAWNALSEGSLTLEFYARDVPGNIGTTEVIIEKDTQAPIIIINSPNDGDVFGADPPSFDLNISDLNLDSIWFSVNDIIINFNPAILEIINQTAWLALPEGNITIIIYANDTLGNLASEELTIMKNVPSKGGIGLDYFMTSFLIFLMGGIAVIIVIARMYSKRKLIS